MKTLHAINAILAVMCAIQCGYSFAINGAHGCILALLVFGVVMAIVNVVVIDQRIDP